MKDYPVEEEAAELRADGINESSMEVIALEESAESMTAADIESIPSAEDFDLSTSPEVNLDDFILSRPGADDEDAKDT